MGSILLLTYQSDAYGDKVENKRDVIRNKKVTKGGLQKLPNTFQTCPFQQKLPYPGIYRLLESLARRGSSQPF